MISPSHLIFSFLVLVAVCIGAVFMISSMAGKTAPVDTFNTSPDTNQSAVGNLTATTGVVGMNLYIGIIFFVVIGFIFSTLIYVLHQRNALR